MRWTWVIGMRRRQFRQTHLAGLGIEPPNVVGFFVGEPQNAIVIEYGCVRIDLAAAGWDHNQAYDALLSIKLSTSSVRIVLSPLFMEA